MDIDKRIHRHQWQIRFVIMLIPCSYVFFCLCLLLRGDLFPLRNWVMTIHAKTLRSSSIVEIRKLLYVGYTSGYNRRYYISPNGNWFAGIQLSFTVRNWDAKPNKFIYMSGFLWYIFYSKNVVEWKNDWFFSSKSFAV